MPLQRLQDDILDVLHILAQELLTGHGQELLLRHDLHLPGTEAPEPGWRAAEEPQTQRCGGGRLCSSPPFSDLEAQGLGGGRV